MAENTQVQDPEAIKAAEENERFKKRLKDEYGIEDDVETFKQKRERWIKAEEENPQYQASLNALISHFRSLEEESVKEPVRGATDEDEEEQRLRTIAKLDPYEGAKRLMAKKEQEWKSELQKVREEGQQTAQRTTLARETMRRSADIVRENWPEAFDEKTELFKMGHRIYNQEMSEQEKRDPRAFLIATERAAGRVGLPPKARRGSSTKRAEVSAQNVSRQGSTRPSDEEDREPLTPRQKKIIEGLQVDEKTYRLARKNRRDQAKPKDDE